jgi:hypothetical protein
MNRLVLVVLVAACHVASTSKSDPTTTTSQAPSGAEPSGSSPRAEGSQLDEHAFYTISTVVDGQELAITFVPPKGPDIKSVNNNAGKSRVELRSVTNAPDQLWQPHPEGADDTLLYAKIKDEGQENGGVLLVYNVDKRLEDSGDDKYNRPTVGSHTNETREYWQLESVAGGKFRIKNAVGMSAHPDEEEWDAPRALEAVKGSQGFKLRNMPLRDNAAQQWTFKKQ